MVTPKQRDKVMDGQAGKPSTPTYDQWQLLRQLVQVSNDYQRLRDSVIGLAVSCQEFPAGEFDISTIRTWTKAVQSLLFADSLPLDDHRSGDGMAFDIRYLIPEIWKGYKPESSSAPDFSGDN